jgi:hypothetical protein
LTAFLRARKYSLPKSIKNLEYFISSIQLFPQYYEKFEAVFEEDSMKIFDSGYVLFMPERQKDGSRIILHQPKFIDLEKLSPTELIRKAMAIVTLINKENETQIAGVIHIFDMTDFPKRLLTYLTVSDYKSIIYLLAHVLPLRQKAFYIVGLPSFARQLLNWGMAFMHRKLKKRVVFVKDLEVLKNFVDFKLLPLEYGGKFSIPEHINFLKENLLKHRDLILSTIDIDADLKKNLTVEEISEPEIDLGIAGSFRKLEID